MQRRAEAWRIFLAPDPNTGKKWKTKEACKIYLMASKKWSRTTCNTYLRGKNWGEPLTRG
jgi:hypothetical protein